MVTFHDNSRSDTICNPGLLAKMLTPLAGYCYKQINTVETKEAEVEVNHCCCNFAYRAAGCIKLRGVVVTWTSS